MLIAAEIQQATGYQERLASHMVLTMVTESQPPLDGAASAGSKMQPNETRRLQKMQVEAAIIQGGFAADKELAPEYVSFLKTLNPAYQTPSKKEISNIRDALHKDLYRYT